MKVLIISMLLAFLGAAYAADAFNIDPSKQEFVIEVKTNEFCNVTLRCTYNVPVYCQWKRRDRPVDIGGRYTYTKGDREAVRDCSLDIKYVTPADMTYWTCEGYSTSDTTKSPKFKTYYHISSESQGGHTMPNILHASRQHIHDNDRCKFTPGTLYGPQLVLLKNFTTSSNNYNCKFGSHVDKCSWKSNDTANLADGEMEYSKNNGRDTDDCTMKTGSKFIKTKKVHRCEAKKEMIVQNPKTGGTVWLSCHSTKPVKCLWKRNHEDVPISGRFKYDSGNGLNVQDCSIKFTAYNPATDAGLWICYKSGDTDDSHNVLGGQILI